MRSSTELASHNYNPSALRSILNVLIFLSIGLVGTVIFWLAWHARVWILSILQNFYLVSGAIVILGIAYFIWLAVEACNAPEMPSGQWD